MTASDASWEHMVAVGRVARTQGNRGEVIVDPATDFPDRRFHAGAVVFVEVDGHAQAYRILRARSHAGRPVLALDGVGTMSEAEGLAGRELRVPAAALEPLPAGSFYVHDLVGCAVQTVGGEAVGRVVAVRGPAGAQRLIVASTGVGGDAPPAGEVDVPLVEAICVRIAPAERVIVIDPPDGLLELNR